jgi:hypothetical protein
LVRHEREAAVHAHRAARAEAGAYVLREEQVQVRRDLVRHAELRAGKRVVPGGPELAAVLHGIIDPALRFEQRVVDHVDHALRVDRKRADRGTELNIGRW